MKFKATVIFILSLFFYRQGNGKDFSTYNFHINKAELAIIDNRYADALHSFDSALIFDSVSYAQDLFNASLCALKIGLHERSLWYCYKLAQRGVGIEFFDTKTIFGPLKSNHVLWDSLLVLAKDKQEYFNAKYADILLVVDSLVQKDQAMNKRWRDSKMDSEVERLMDLTNDTIAKALHNLLTKEGFLSEKLIGAKPNPEGEFYIRTPFDVIIIHNYESRRVGDSLFNDVLYDALINELIKQDYYAFIRDFAGGHSSIDYFGSGHLFVQYNCTIYKSKFADLEEIKKQRKRIGLGTLEDYAKKIVFNIQNPSSDFQINGHCAKYMNFKNKESEEMFLKGHEIFIAKIPNCQ
jgi:hypothetical protein